MKYVLLLCTVLCSLALQAHAQASEEDCKALEDKFKSAFDTCVKSRGKGHGGNKDAALMDSLTPMVRILRQAPGESSGKGPGGKGGKQRGGKPGGGQGKKGEMVKCFAKEFEGNNLLDAAKASCANSGEDMKKNMQCVKKAIKEDCPKLKFGRGKHGGGAGGGKGGGRGGGDKGSWGKGKTTVAADSASEE